jgi:hypothetical protein
VSDGPDILPPPGKCPRADGLVAGIPDPVEFHLDLTVTPGRPAERAGRAHVRVFDPWKDHRVEKFSIIHEKPFHAFVVSRDLQFFLHDHPTWENGAFHYRMKFPRRGVSRSAIFILRPQRNCCRRRSLPGPEAPVTALKRDYSQKRAENLSVDFSISP